ncbi:GIY-YIG nuclease family protein [Synechococcus elongatus]|uniref:GIY-YIG nuclease family protein n=1 Tax=Synechococcus elongatus TaxID=32046 RepID=UPI0030D1C86F
MEQLPLFGRSQVRELEAARYGSAPAEHEQSAESLQAWKQRIINFQSALRSHPPALPTDLFGQVPEAVAIAHSIDPWQLRRRSLEFWRWPAASAGTAALYFVIDYHCSLLLYVGETIKANQRWKGEHDCKDYVARYQSLHHQHGLACEVGIGFWLNAPTQTRPRQQLETILIDYWRSPFNKQNWRQWGTPFTT